MNKTVLERNLHGLTSEYLQYLNSDLVTLLAIYLVALVSGTINAHVLMSTAIAGHKAGFLATSLFLLGVQGLTTPFLLTQDRPLFRSIYPVALLVIGTCCAIAFLFGWKVFFQEYVQVIDALRHIAETPAADAGQSLLEKYSSPLPILTSITASLLFSAAIECMLWNAVRRLRSSRKP